MNIKFAVLNERKKLAHDPSLRGIPHTISTTARAQLPFLFAFLNRQLLNWQFEEAATMLATILPKFRQFPAFVFKVASEILKHLHGLASSQRIRFLGLLSDVESIWALPIIVEQSVSLIETRELEVAHSLLST